jgi:hypothetical protein
VPVIPATQEIDTGRSRLEAILGKIEFNPRTTKKILGS